MLAPDLNAYLVLVCETLGRLAGMEYDLGPARKWTERSRALLKALTDELWNGEAFVGKNPYTGETSGPDEALSAVPLVLGGRLPPEIAAKLPVEAADSPEHCLMAAGAFDAGRRDEVRAMTRRALEAVRAGTADDPFYGAALLWLAHKVL